MLENIRIRTIQNGDFENVVKLWNETYEDEPINNVVFKRKVLLDVNFDPDGFIIAEDGQKMRGFIYIIMRKVPIDAGGDLEPEKSWINGVGILPEDFEYVGRKLLDAAEDFVVSRGAKNIRAMTYTPNYFTQGFNIKKQQHYIQLFKEAGYKVVFESVSMDRDLLAYKEPPDVKETKACLESEGYTFCHLSDELLLPFLDFMKNYQPPGWMHRVRKLLLDNNDYTRVQIAMYKGEVIGFNIHNDPDGSPERFGPFGVRKDFRGKGIGKVLLSECLLTMKARGLHNTWFQMNSPGGTANFLYKKLGFVETRRYVILEKNFE